MSKHLTIVCLLCVAAPAFAQAPGAPQNLTASVSGTTVTLSWTPPGGTVTGYLVEASATPGGGIIATLNVVGATSVGVPGVPVGTYFVRVRALNGAAQSVPSNEVTVMVGGGGGSCTAAPLAPNLIVRATGLNVTLEWSQPGGCPASNYMVLAGSGPGLANIAQVNMGAGTALGSPAPPGVYFIRVIASNAFGSSSSEEQAARVAINAFTDTVGPASAAGFPIVAAATGTYRATLMWTDPTIDLDLYLTAAGCPFPPTGCGLAASQGAGVNTEQVAFAVGAGQSYRLWVPNNSATRSTSFSVTSTITP
jgi:predicted phage tail protein